jgi:O-acetyl-ADP-ribose deacetylase (regulator of RNase III)
VGGGVDAAIHKRGGPKILQDTRKRFPMGCRTGCAVASLAGDLACKVVIHAVGPIWRNDPKRESELLRRAYESSLEVAAENECESIAFPAISCGAFGFPVELAAEIALQTMKTWTEKHAVPRDIRFVLFTESAGNPFLAKAAEIFGVPQV